MAVAPGSGNLFNLRAQTSQDLDLLSAGFSTPLGDDGLRLSLDASSLRYALGGRTAPLEAKGDAQTYSARLAYPWIRSYETNLYVSADLSHKRYNDDALGLPLKRRRVSGLGLELAGNHIDQLGGGGRNDASLKLVLGNADLDGVAGDLAQDKPTANVDGSFQRIGGRLSRLQLLGAKTSLLVAVSGQLAAQNLNSSEKFSLGGPSGVRAYPVGEASGDDAWLINLELKRELAEGWSTSAFIDSGWIRTWHDTWAGWNAGSNTPVSYHLHGAGVSLSWIKPESINLDITAALPLGSNRGRQADGTNQDGSERSPHLWISYVKYF